MKFEALDRLEKRCAQKNRLWDRTLFHSLSLRSRQLVDRSPFLRLFYARLTRQDVSSELLFVKFQAFDRLQKGALKNTSLGFSIIFTFWLKIAWA